MYFDERIEVRLRDQDKEEIMEQVRRLPNQYENLNHFIRVAILRELQRARDTHLEVDRSLRCDRCHESKSPGVRMYLVNGQKICRGCFFTYTPTT